MDQYLVIGPDGKEFGPVDLAGLQQWIREGRVLKETRVRKNGGAAVVVESLAEVAEVFAPPPPPPTPPIATTVPIPTEFKSWSFIGQAWELFKPQWVPLCVMFLIVSLAGAIPYVGWLIAFVLMVGVNRAVLGLLAGRTPQIEMVFGGFDRLGQALAAGIIICLLVGAGLVFLIVPGIYLAIMWSLTNLVLAETQQDFWTAMQTSAALTKGYRWEIFCLCLALIPIYILGLLACCVGTVVSQAVATIAFALVYRFLQSRQTTSAVALVP